MKHHSHHARLLAALAVLSCTTAHAAVFLTETFNGIGNGNCTLGGTPLGSNFYFTLSATFDADPTANTFSPADGVSGVYPVISYSLTISTVIGGSYTGTSSSLYAYISEQQDGRYAILGLTTDSTGQSFPDISLFLQPGSAPNSTLGVTPEPLGPASIAIDSFNSISLPLNGVPGGFATGNYNANVYAASITAVPEPSAFASVAGAGLLGFAFWRQMKTDRPSRNQ
jgi:hypothetical protein